MCLLCGTGGNIAEKSHVEKSNNKELIQSTLYDQQTPYCAWKFYFPDQCRFDKNFVIINDVIEYPTVFIVLLAHLNSQTQTCVCC